MSITSVVINPVNHKLNLIVVQEKFGLMRIFGKVDQEYVTDDGDDNRQNTLPDWFIIRSDFHLFSINEG